MQVLVAAIGALICLVGAFAALQPEQTKSLLVGLLEGRRLYGALGFRLFGGVVLVAAADGCRHPAVVEVLGWITILAAATGALMGLARLRALVRWFAERPLAVLRIWAFVAIALGAYFVYEAV